MPISTKLFCNIWFEWYFDATKTVWILSWERNVFNDLQISTKLRFKVDLCYSDKYKPFWQQFYYFPSPFRLLKYLQHNRNLKLVRDNETMTSLLKYGKMAVLSLLAQLPQTDHDPKSFVSDLTLFNVRWLFVVYSNLFNW